MWLSQGVRKTTKKDYIKLAKAIKDCRDRLMIEPWGESGVGIIYTEGFIQELCNILKDDNPRFDKEQFMEACGTK